MNNLETLIEKYLIFCQTKKRLDPKSLKAYRIDLHQFQLKVPHKKSVRLTVMY